MWPMQFAVPFLGTSFVLHSHFGWGWLPSITFAVTVAAVTALFVRQYYRASGEPPLFGGWIPFLGHAIEFGTNYRELLQRLASASGSAPAFTVFVAGKRMTFIKSALDFPHVLKESKRLSFDAFAFSVSKNVVSFNCSFDDPGYQGFDHTLPSQYRMLKGGSLNAMMQHIKPSLLKSMREHEHQLASSTHLWQTEEDLNDLVSRLVWQMTAHSLFGDLILKPLAGEEGNEVGPLERSRQAFLKFDDKFALLAGGVPIWFAGKDCADGISHLKSLFSRFGHDDIPSNVSALFTFRQKYMMNPANGISVHDAACLQVIFMWAMFANTLPAACWTLFWVLRDKECLRACREEVERVFEPHLRSSNPAPADDLRADVMENMPCVQSVLEEALRLGIGSLTVRVAQENCTLALGKDKQRAVRVRKGDQVVLSPSFSHFDPEMYPEPAVFRWNRFMRPKNRSSPVVRRKQGRRVSPSVALMPFGGGTSMCPGRFLAMAEIKMLVATVLLRWDVELTTDMDGDTLAFGVTGIPSLQQVGRGGLGMLSPADKIPCRWRVRGA